MNYNVYLSITYRKKRYRKDIQLPFAPVVGMHLYQHGIEPCGSYETDMVTILSVEYSVSSGNFLCAVGLRGVESESDWDLSPQSGWQLLERNP